MMDCVQPQQQKELRLVMLGRTGAGMTSTANSILQEKILEERVNTRSKTQLCEFVQRNIDDRRLTIVDSPGFFNTQKSEKDTELEIDRCVSMVPPGPHAFLLVISMTNRFPPEAQDTIRRIEAKFGKDIYKYLIVVFTGKDQLDSEKRTFEEFRQNGIHPMIEDVLRKCDQRCVAFNNKPDKEENTTQVKTLLDVVGRMVSQNDGDFYSADKFKSTGQKIRRKFAKCTSTVRELFRFNITTLYYLVCLVIFFVMLIPLIYVLLTQSTDSISRKTEAPDSNIESQVNSTNSSLLLRTRRPPPLPVDLLTNYPTVMLNAVRMGYCRENEQNRTELGYYEPPPPFDLQYCTYAKVALNTVGRGWCLVTEKNTFVVREQNITLAGQNNLTVSERNITLAGQNNLTVSERNITFIACSWGDYEERQRDDTTNDKFNNFVSKFTKFVGKLTKPVGNTISSILESVVEFLNNNSKSF